MPIGDITGDNETCAFVQVSHVYVCACVRTGNNSNTKMATPGIEPGTF